MKKIRIGDKLVEVEMKNGVPVVKAKCEQIKHPDGRVDIVVKVSYLKIQTEKKD